MAATRKLPVTAPSTTCFRVWMEQLNARRGPVAEWPFLLREMLTAEYLCQRERRIEYAGEVYQPRHDCDPSGATKPEPRAVMSLLTTCRTKQGGVLGIGEERFWLLGYEWPNEGGRGLSRKCADLIGLTASGGVVVFECKLENPYGPFKAVLEGLDYLSCLTSEPNMSKILTGFTRDLEAGHLLRPSGFESAVPNRDARHEVIVLASAGYYAQYRASDRGRGWELFASLPPAPSAALSIRFAETDFSSPQGRWVTG